MRRFTLAAVGLLLAAPSLALAQSQQAQQPVAIEEQRTITVIPADQIPTMQQQLSASSDHDRLWVAVPFDEFNNLQSGSTSTMSTIPPSGSGSAATAVPYGSAGSSTRSLASYMGRDRALLIVPKDQLHYFTTAADRHDVLVLMPYDRFTRLSSTGTFSPTGRERAGFQPGSGRDGSAWHSSGPLIGRDDAVLIVPIDELKSFNTAPCANCQEPLVVMPLTQFDQVAQVSQEPAAMVYTPPAERRLYGLQPAGEATAINEVFPVAGGRILLLNDGETFLLPDSVTVDGGSALDTGTQVRGQYEKINGQNLITWLSVDESQGSHHESGNSGGGS